MEAIQPIIDQVVSVTLAGVNVTLVVVLIGIGALLKHAIKALDNQYIPVILTLVSIILVIVMNIPFNPQTHLLTYLVEGFASALIATIVHEKGKDIFTSLKGIKGS